ncbi:MAG: glycoside hydrolase family 3 protein [Candidatus Eisenbacteria bacterium]|uniref:Glycoside hydrolase family 3 protein n=1 Tax=Eiseniibacteriota bacterium TaxID=2212470 RepID=A0A9D6L9R1_UNCEI|nr:glycoside hydrolase family 3 protein [Candidatus Eisenbacteria bacterium]MBI3540394.1 glycoside hydrolase family 3 protein [Candidatus Eisenbacteria bacterium]
MDAQRGIARRLVVGLPREGLTAAWERDVAAFPPAGVILFARDFRDLDDLRRLTARLRALVRPRRLFIAMDEEGGFVSQLAGHLVVPPNAALLARGAAPGDLAWIAQVTGARLRALGVDWPFAPVADVASEPRNPVIGPRAFGAAPDPVARAVAETVRGLRSANAAVCLKHFPGHGDTVLDSHLALPRCDASREALDARELAPFRANLDADAVMTAHVVYPSLDPDRPATFSRAIVHDLLRETLGFRGVAITDALEMKGAAEGRGAFETARLALAAGCDLLLFAFHDEAVRRARLELARALVDGAIDRASYDAARPRLAAFDAAHAEPGDDELARPLASLTPDDWEPRLEAIVARGLIVRGGLPAAAASRPWRVHEPAFAHGPTLAADLAAQGIAVTSEAPGVEVIAVMTRVPFAPAEIERMRAICRERPTVLVGLQSDAFLDDVPEAALRISASDATPLTRRVVARTLGRMVTA